MIDSHCHLDLKAFDNDRDDVINRALKAGVTHLHIPGTTDTGWRIQLELAQRFCEVDYSIGLHPYFLNSQSVFNPDQAERFIASAGVLPLAIGEIGLDASIDVPKQTQRQVCLAQLNFAQQLHLPVILHHRKTGHELLQLMKQAKFSFGGVIHAFSGSLELAKQFIDAGFALGIGGTITYPRAQKTRNTVSLTGLNHLLLETDSPDMPNFGMQGKRNEPAYLEHVCKQMAELKGVSTDLIKKQTTENYLRIFKRNLRIARNK